MVDKGASAGQLKAVRNLRARGTNSLPRMVNNETVLFSYVVSLTLHCAAKWFHLLAIW
jgi:hypothetical protein